jgi:membrane protease YdiL (CAAX protease family)
MNVLHILLENGFAFVGYILAILSLIACWVYPKYYLFAPLYLLAYLCGYFGGVVTYQSLFPLGAILICLIILEFYPKKFIHLFSAMIVAILGAFIMTHMVKGFENLVLIKGVTFGKSESAINLYLNFDKISFAIFLLGISIPLLKNKQEWKHMILITIPWIAFSAFILLGFSKAAGLINLDIKFPSATFYWLTINFFFVVIPEEAFYRGFLQNQISKSLANKAAPLLAIICVSLLFALMHIFFVQDLTFILSTFIASILYGTIYFFSGSIESAIITHFSVNIIHFFFFSYPLI